jgi:hypothetical protein
MEVTLKSLKNTSRSILSKMLPIVQELQEDKNGIVDEIIYKRKKLDYNTVLEDLRNICINMIADATNVDKEIDEFTISALKGGKSLETSIEASIDISIEKHPFLSEVWYGDVYDDKSGQKALEELQHELSKILPQINEDKIIRNYIKDKA